MIDPELAPLSPEQRRAHEALHALDARPADPVFRDALRQRFVSGAFPPRTAEREAARPGGTARWWQLVESLGLGRPAVAWTAAAAALIVVVLGAGALNRGPQWRVTAVTGDGVAVVGSLPVPVRHADELTRRLAPGARVRVPDGAEIEIASGDQLVIQMTPGTDVTVPAPPGRWFSRDVSASVRAGELRIATGPRYHGARLSLTTRTARIMVTGTTLAVICDPEGTCVCVLEGRVGVGRPEGPLVDVEAGRLRFVFGPGREPISAEMRPAERIKLGVLRERMRTMTDGEE